MSAHTSSRLLAFMAQQASHSYYGVILMSLIPCTQNCKFQDEGLCTLAQANPDGQAVPNDACLNFTPRPSNQHGNGLSDVIDANQV